MKFTDVLRRYSKTFSRIHEICSRMNGMRSNKNKIVSASQKKYNSMREFLDNECSDVLEKVDPRDGAPPFYRIKNEKEFLNHLSSKKFEIKDEDE